MLGCITSSSTLTLQGRAQDFPPPSTCRWNPSFLSDSRQQVKLGSDTSSTRTVSTGTPRGPHVFSPHPHWPHRWRWGVSLQTRSGTAGLLLQLHSGSSVSSRLLRCFLNANKKITQLGCFQPVCFHKWCRAEVFKVSPQQIIYVCVILRLTKKEEDTEPTTVPKHPWKTGTFQNVLIWIMSATQKTAQWLQSLPALT